MAAQLEEMSSSHSRVLSSGIYQLLLQRRMLDVTITCGGEAIMAHKAVLVSYSKFLDTVFAGQGDDCDVLNMDNLGLEFEAIRAVIFFMYKGVVDTERCGDAAFQQAAKVLCVDVSMQPSAQPAEAEQPTPPPIIMASPQVVQPTPASEPTPPLSPQSNRSAYSKSGKPACKAATKSKMIDQYTMTEQSRITRLSREVQTDSKVTGLPGDVGVDNKKKKPKNAYAQTEISPVKMIPDGQRSEMPLSTGLEKSVEHVLDVGIVEKKEEDPIREPKEESSPKVVRKRGRPPKKANLNSSQKQTPSKQVVKEEEEELDRRATTPEQHGNTIPVRTSARKRKISAKLKDSLENNDLVQEILKPRQSQAVAKQTEVTGNTPKRGRGRPRKKEIQEQPKNVKASPSEMKKLIVKLTRTQKVQENVSASATDVHVNSDDDKDTEGEANENATENTNESDCSDGESLDYSAEQHRRRRSLSVRAKSDLHSESKRCLWKRTEDGAYQCLLCDWRRESSRSLTVHLRIHLGEKPFVCDRCNKAFRTTDKLRDHIRTHTGERPFTCPVCSRGFSTRKNMSRHKEIHQRDNPLNKCYLCEECGTRFYSVKRLNSHIRRRHGVLTKKRIPCQISDCSFTAGDKKTMMYHLAEVHGHALPAELVTVCNVCGASVRKSSLRMHMMIHAAKNIKCERCNFVTQYTQTLKGHMRRLHGVNLDGTPAVRPYVCDICPEAYFSRQQLTYHKMRHTGEKPHLCPICNFRTVDKGSMNMHIRTHTGVMPYRCKHCDKCFKQSSALSWHVKTVHMGLRRFTCTICDKHYVNKKDLHAHRFSKHLHVKPFSCSLCTHSCTKKDYMIAHIEKVHGAEYIPEDLKDMKQMLNVVTKLEDMGQLEQEASNQDDKSINNLTQFASCEISTLEQNTDNIPLLIVSENTLKDLLVPQASTAVVPKQEVQSEVVETKIKLEESEIAETIQESGEHQEPELSQDGVPDDEKNGKENGISCSLEDPAKPSGGNNEVAESGNIIWTVASDSQLGNGLDDTQDNKHAVLLPVNSVTATAVEQLTYEEGVAKSAYKDEKQEEEQKSAEVYDQEELAQVPKAEQPCYEIRFVDAGQEQAAEEKCYPGDQQFIEIAEDQLQISEGQFIVVDETDTGEHVIMVSNEKQIVLAEGQQLVQAGSDSLVIMSDEQPSPITTNHENT